MCHTAKWQSQDLNPPPPDSWIPSYTFCMKETSISGIYFFFKHCTPIQIYFFLLPVKFSSYVCCQKIFANPELKASSLSEIDISTVCWWILALKRDFSSMSIIWLYENVFLPNRNQRINNKTRFHVLRKISRL